MQLCLNVDVSNAADLLLLADLHGATSLGAVARTYVASHMDEVAETAAGVESTNVCVRNCAGNYCVRNGTRLHNWLERAARVEEGWLGGEGEWPIKQSRGRMLCNSLRNSLRRLWWIRPQQSRLTRHYIARMAIYGLRRTTENCCRHFGQPEIELLVPPTGKVSADNGWSGVYLFKSQG